MEQEMKNAVKTALADKMYQYTLNLMASKLTELEDHPMKKVVSYVLHS